MSKKLVCLVSGGTGGHVFPALALAEKLHKQHHYTCLLTEARGDTFSKSENLTMVMRVPIVRHFSFLSSIVYPLSMAWSVIYCLILLGRMRPDVLVADVILEGATGPAVARRLRENLPELEIVFVSGHSSPDAVFVKEMGARFLAKPFRSADLVREIDGLLAERQGAAALREGA